MMTRSGKTGPYARGGPFWNQAMRALFPLLFCLLVACGTPAAPPAPIATVDASVGEGAAPPTFIPSSTATPEAPTAEPTVAAEPTATTEPSPTATAIGMVEVTVEPPSSYDAITGWLPQFIGSNAGPDAIRDALIRGDFMEGPDDWRVVDVSGDGTPEWVLRVLVPEASVDIVGPWGRPGQILIFDPAAAAVVFQQASDLDGSPALIATEDLTGDGRPDVLVEFTYCGASTCTQSYYLASAHGRVQPENLLRGDDATMPVTMTYSEATVADRTGDGVADLVLAGGTFGSVGAGPQRAREELYAWDGEAVTLQATSYEPSPLRYFHLLDANRALAEGRVAEAITLYEETIHDPSLETSYWDEGWAETSEQAAIERYAYFRLVYASLLQDRTPQAGDYLNEMRARYPDDPLTEAAQRLVDGYARSAALDEACTAATDYAGTVEGITAPLDYMGYANPDLTAATLCPPP